MPKWKEHISKRGFPYLNLTIFIEYILQFEIQFSLSSHIHVFPPIPLPFQMQRKLGPRLTQVLSSSIKAPPNSFSFQIFSFLKIFSSPVQRSSFFQTFFYQTLFELCEERTFLLHCWWSKKQQDQTKKIDSAVVSLFVVILAELSIIEACHNF